MKRINRNKHDRLERLANQLASAFADKSRGSYIIYRGDVSAILWAAWFIREQIDAEKVAQALREGA